MKVSLKARSNPIFLSSCLISWNSCTMFTEAEETRGLDTADLYSGIHIWYLISMISVSGISYPGLSHACRTTFSMYNMYKAAIWHFGEHMKSSHASSFVSAWVWPLIMSLIFLILPIAIVYIVTYECNITFHSIMSSYTTPYYSHNFCQLYHGCFQYQNVLQNVLTLVHDLWNVCKLFR